LQGDEWALGTGADVARQGDRRRGQGRERARHQGSVVGRAQSHRSRARRALLDGTDRRTRSLESRLHLRLENGYRRDAEMEGRRLYTRVAEQDRDGSGDEGEGRCDVEGSGHRPVNPTHDAPRTTHEGQTFSGESLLIRYVNFVKLPHTVFALPFALLG